MKIRIVVGDVRSGEWGEHVDVSLLPYAEVFRSKHPDLPPISEGFEDSYSIEDAMVETGTGVTVAFDAHYHQEKGSMSIIVKHDDKSFIQVTGQAVNEDGLGLSLLFEVPGTEVPVHLCCVP